MNHALVCELATALFLGPPGTGKSQLAQAIGRAAILRGYRPTPSGSPESVITFGRIQRSRSAGIRT